MKIETEVRIRDHEGNVVYSNTYSHEESDVVDPRAILADYAVLAPNRAKKQLAVGLEQYSAHIKKKEAERVQAEAEKEQKKLEAAAAKSKPTRKRSPASKRGAVK